MIDIATTRNSAGDMKTTTSGPALAGGGLNELFATLVRQKMAQKAAPTPRAALPAFARDSSQPAYTPALSSGDDSLSARKSAPVPVTRMRDIPQNPYDAMSRIPGGMGGTGHTNTARVERYIPGIGWEFDGLYDQRGGR